MNDLKKDRNLTVIIIVAIVLTYFMKNWGKAIVSVSDLDLLSALLLFILIGATIIGLAIPFLDPGESRVFDRRIIVVIVVLIVLAVAIFLPLRFNVFGQKVYEYAFDGVSALALCVLFWLNHRNFVKLNKAQSNRAVLSALSWTGISTNALVGLMWALRGKKQK